MENDFDDSPNDNLSLGSKDWWDIYFMPGGGWEKNNGRFQTRKFAEAFLRYSDLDKRSSFSFLDVGCAIGDAISIFHKHFNLAKFTGVDLSKTAIERCRELYGDFADFEIKRIEDINEKYDVIYISNVIEHFEDYRLKALHLMNYCNRLFIMVPYQELRNGRPLFPDPKEHHQASFYKDSFDFLYSHYNAIDIKVTIFSCPGAWGWKLPRWIVEKYIKNPLRLIAGIPLAENQKMILYSITKK